MDVLRAIGNTSLARLREVVPPRKAAPVEYRPVGLANLVAGAPGM